MVARVVVNGFIFHTHSMSVAAAIHRFVGYDSQTKEEEKGREREWTFYLLVVPTDSIYGKNNR